MPMIVRIIEKMLKHAKVQLQKTDIVVNIEKERKELNLKKEDKVNGCC